MIATSFSPTEAAALLDIPEKQVRKEVEHGLFSTTLSFAALVYLRALRGLGLRLGVEDRRRLLKTVRETVQAGIKASDTVPFSDVVMLKLGSVAHDVEAKVESFFRWRDTLVTDRRVLVGEPVFPKSRLSVRHVGALVERGAATSEILEDYPYLTDRDLQFALVFVRAYPRVGRPREAGQAPAR